jgi:beta-glucosidase
LLITPEKLSFYDIKKNFVVEAGEFDVMVGNSSRTEDLKKVVLTVK